MIYYIDTSEIFFGDCSAYFINSKNDEFITCGKITTPIVDENDSNFINTTKETFFSMNRTAQRKFMPYLT